MPRDKGGHGRTGSKAKVAAAKRAAAAEAARTTPSTSPSAADAATTNDKEEEEEVTAAAADPISENTRPRRRGRIRKVRFVVDRPPKERKPPYLWSWTGGATGRPTLKPGFALMPQHQPHRADRQGLEALRAHLWGLRVAEHVAAGCVGEWVGSYSRDSAWARKASHRSWCPDALPDPMLRHGRWCCDATEWPGAREMFCVANETWDDI